MNNKNLLLFIFTFLFSLHSFGQNHELRLSGELAHLVHNKAVHYAEGYHFIGVEGVEFGYFHGLDNGWKIGTSMVYEWNTFYAARDVKSYCNESSISLLFNKILFQNDEAKNIYSTGFGIYNGIVSKADTYLHHAGNWLSVADPDWRTQEFKERLFTDLYLDFECRKMIDNNTAVALAPFIKYRINKTWLNDIFSGFQFGMKIQVAFFW